MSEQRKPAHCIIASLPLKEFAILSSTEAILDRLAVWKPKKMAKEDNELNGNERNVKNYKLAIVGCLVIK
jgi:hypothetical protein